MTKNKQREELTPKDQTKTTRVTFTVDVSTPMLRGLRAFLDGHNYDYKEAVDG